MTVLFVLVLVWALVMTVLYFRLLSKLKPVLDALKSAEEVAVDDVKKAYDLVVSEVKKLLGL